jgi:hypothetical protein
MFLHLGAERVVPINKIIGIFDIENTTVSKITKQFLQIASEEEDWQERCSQQNEANCEGKLSFDGRQNSDWIRLGVYG